MEYFILVYMKAPQVIDFQFRIGDSAHILLNLILKRGE